MKDYAQQAIQMASELPLTYCKFITANDVGATGAHQAGLYIHKDSYEIAFSEPGVRGENKDRFVSIK
jgi:Restriction endonuclease EcoRII, N-terminal